MIDNAFKVVDFEDLTLQPKSFNNDSEVSGEFTSNAAFFNNDFNSDFGSWADWHQFDTTGVADLEFANQQMIVKLEKMIPVK